MRYIPLALLAVAICGLGFTWLTYSKSRELNCSSESSCLNSNFRITDLDTNLHAAYKGRLVDDICFTRVHITSSGEIPIVEKDFNGQPIVISLGKESRIIEAHAEDNPRALVHPNLTSDSMNITVQPLLMNPGDAFSIYVVTTGGQPVISANARITGVSAIDSIARTDIAPRLDIAKWLIVLVIFCLSTGLLSLTSKGIYYGSPNKQAVVFLPKHRFTQGLLALLWIAFIGLLVIVHFMPRSWVLPSLIAISSSMLISMLMFQFNGLRWVVYKEVKDKNEREKLSSTWLGPSD